MKEMFTKVKGYFTANACRKVFFFAVLLGIIGLILNVIIPFYLFYLLMVAGFMVGVGASLVDSMIARHYFLHKVKEMQYAHLQAIYEQEQAGKEVAMTPTFTEAEKKYIRRKKWSSLGVICFKLVFVIVLFSLLFPW